MAIDLEVNGVSRRYDGPPERPLLWYLREDLGLTGTKFGCGVALCGACLVLVGDAAVPACRTTMGGLHGTAVTTIEGLAARDDPVIAAWRDAQVPQCGYCQPGQVIAATALLRTTPRPSPTQTEAAMDRVLCRCGTYQRARRALAALTGGHDG